MAQKIKKTNIFLALFLSLLTAILGAGIFGLIYGFGYYIYLLSAFQIYLTCVVFLKFIKKIRWWHVLIALIWGTILSFVLSMLAIPVINNNTRLSCGKFHFGHLKYYRNICLLFFTAFQGHGCSTSEEENLFH